METVEGKKTTYRYYHMKCFEIAEYERAFRQHERKEMDELCEVIKEIYGVTTIPSTIFPYIQDLRNGTRFFGKNDYKYKKGYSYQLIAETFRFCSSTIEYYNSTKTFNGFTHAFKYGLTIVCDKLSLVENRLRNQAQQELIADLHLERASEREEEFQTSYKPKTKKDNLDFLDD